jgi:ribosomal protein L40E
MFTRHGMSNGNNAKFGFAEAGAGYLFIMVVSLCFLAPTLGFVMLMPVLGLFYAALCKEAPLSEQPRYKKLRKGAGWAACVIWVAACLFKEWGGALAGLALVCAAMFFYFDSQIDPFDGAPYPWAKRRRRKLQSKDQPKPSCESYPPLVGAATCYIIASLVCVPGPLLFVIMLDIRSAGMPTLTTESFWVLLGTLVLTAVFIVAGRRVSARMRENEVRSQRRGRARVSARSLQLTLPLEGKLCAYCGRDNPQDAIWCRECGTTDFKLGQCAQAQSH